MGNGFVLKRDFENSRREPLAGAQEKGHPLPAPVVDVKLDGRKSFRRGIFADVFFVMIPLTCSPLILPAPHCPRRANRGTSSGRIGRVACRTSTYLF